LFYKVSERAVDLAIFACWPRTPALLCFF